VLAKYCDKKEQLKASRNLAEKILDAGRFKDFQKILSEVIVGELKSD